MRLAKDTRHFSTTISRATSITIYSLATTGCVYSATLLPPSPSLSIFLVRTIFITREPLAEKATMNYNVAATYNVV